MSLDSLEDARIAAIEGIAGLRTKDPRIYKVLLDGMEHEDPAIRLASLNAIRKLTRKDLGTEPGAWKRELKSLVEGAGAPVLAAEDGSRDAAVPPSGPGAATVGSAGSAGAIQRSTAVPPSTAISPLLSAPRR
jgi:hypothetical protein